MSNSMENVFPDYKISPDHQKKIARALESGRFNDSREFVFRAIEVFLAWETNPQMATQKMTEMSPTPAQYALMQGMMDANHLKQMYHSNLTYSKLPHICPLYPRGFSPFLSTEIILRFKMEESKKKHSKVIFSLLKS